MLGLSISLSLEKVKNDYNYVEIQDLKENVGAFAYLIAPNTTTIGAINTYYPVSGIFNNSIMSYFYYSFADNAIVFNNSRNRYLVTHWSTSLTHSSAGAKLMIGIKKSGILQQCGVMETNIKFAGDYASVSGTCVSLLAPNDTIQLVISSDKTGTITINKFVTYINHFFNGADE